MRHGTPIANRFTMEWFKAILPILETGLKLYLSGKIIQDTARNAKSAAVRGAVVLTGAIIFFVFLMVSIILVMVNLGQQFDARDGVHFSGMMLSGIYLVILGAIFFGISLIVAKVLENRDQGRKEIADKQAHSYETALMIVEESFKVLKNMK